MRRAIQVILACVLCFFILPAHAAQKPVSIVFLSFEDNTPYSQMKTNEIIEEYLLEKLLDINSVQVMERMVVKEALDAERKLTISFQDIDEVVANNDFASVFAASENDLSNKTKSEHVSSKQTRIIGEKYHADYILHGTIDYLGKGKSYMMVPLPKFTVSSENPYLEAWVTVRLIKAETGEIVWRRKEKGVSKDSLYGIKGFTFGTGEFSNQLFVEAMKKISKKVAKDLSLDIERKSI